MSIMTESHCFGSINNFDWVEGSVADPDGSGYSKKIKSIYYVNYYTLKFYFSL